ncbi:hypothetical protein [Endozoicomonas arenosclerae]|uniref:hypothetical protein n=1 Tax=Endozoicomonas arenosclerae TaxID=1633495 RepID=UPI001294852B|nr:hypothetical protein [Endozoicomonas arenosclerae]
MHSAINDSYSITVPLTAFPGYQQGANASLVTTGGGGDEFPFQPGKRPPGMGPVSIGLADAGFLVDFIALLISAALGNGTVLPTSNNSDHHTQSVGSSEQSLFPNGSESGESNQDDPLPPVYLDWREQTAGNARLHILDYVTELTREFLMSWVINNASYFGPLAEQMRRAYEDGDWSADVFQGIQSFNTLLYLYINDSTFSETDFMEIQMWLQINHHFHADSDVQLLHREVSGSSVEAQRYLAYLGQRLGRFSHLLSQLTSGQRHFTQVVLSSDVSRWLRQYLNVWDEDEHASQYTYQADMQAQIENFEWMIYARDFGYLFIDTESHESLVSIYVPSYSLYSYLLGHASGLPESEWMNPAPFYGEPDIAQLLNLRDRNVHPIAIFHPLIHTSITHPDGRYAGSWLGTLHDLVHVYFLNRLMNQERTFFYQLYQTVRGSLAGWASGTATLPEEFLEHVTRLFEYRDDVSLETIRTVDWGEDAWALFPIVDLGLLMREGGSRAAGLWDMLVRAAFRGQNERSGRYDLVMAQAYLAYLLVNEEVVGPGGSGSFNDWYEDQGHRHQLSEMRRMINFWQRVFAPAVPLRSDEAGEASVI